MSSTRTLAARFDATQACSGLTPRPCNSMAKSVPPLEWDGLPLVIETDGESAWAALDYAVEQLDANTPEGRAMALATA